MKLLTKNQVAVRIAIIISSAEFLIMQWFEVIPQESGTHTEALLDAVFLVVLSTPIIYFWVIMPFVNARDEALAQLNQLADTDPLTRLANRRLISKHLGKIIAGSARHKDHAAVLLLDLDGFKLVNDCHGHEAGDAVLVEIAERLLAVVRSEDVVGRLGGDEFILLIQRLGGDERLALNKALRVAEKLINIVNGPFDYNGKTLRVGVSIGVRLVGFKDKDTETVINEADIAMYRAKESGSGRAVSFER